jgi:hypothetical protein
MACTLEMAGLERQLNRRTRIVAVVHYNTVAEVDRLAEALHALARRRADHFYRFSTNTLVSASERDRIISVGDALTLERTNG